MKCRAVVADDDRIQLRGKKAGGEVSRITDSTEPWEASGVRQSTIVRTLETIPEVAMINGYRNA